MRTLILFTALLLSQALWAQDKSQAVIADNPFTHWDGSTQHTLAEIFNVHEGKVIYIDFWASWCAPCRKEMPASMELHKALGEEVVFVYISIDNSEKAWRETVAKLELEHTGEHYQRKQSDMRDFLRFFGIYSLPKYMIVDKSGQIHESDALPPSTKETERLLRRLMAKKVKS